MLRELAILDTPPESAYDDLARLAAACCNSSVAAVNLVDDVRHWTKAVVGDDESQGASVPSELSFCAAAVASGEELLYVPDTRADERWQAHPSVAQAPHVRHYAGAPIVVCGEPIGVVCVYGPEPRELCEQESEALVALARQASAQLELRKRNSELHALAVRDPLTGLPNRTLLFDRLGHAIEHRRRHGGEVGVLFCDIDGFKAVNDHHGHEFGDRVLCEVAAWLRAAVRDADTVARIAGDEFVVICPRLAEADGLEPVVERIEHLDVPGLDALRLSVGSAFVTDGDTAATVLRRADQAMYAVKAAASI